jgi:hypothetical protein
MAGGRYQMVFNTRDNSNTAINLRRTGQCTLNFIPDDRRYMRNCLMLGYPGETTEEKMRNSVFTLQHSLRGQEERTAGTAYPDLVAEALQVFECSLESVEVDEEIHSMRSILTIDKVLLKERWHKMLVEGKGRRIGRAAAFPPLPVDYGFRNNAHFWFTRHSPPYREPIPKSKAVSVDSVMWGIIRGGRARGRREGRGGRARSGAGAPVQPNMLFGDLCPLLRIPIPSKTDSELHRLPGG